MIFSFVSLFSKRQNGVAFSGYDISPYDFVIADVVLFFSLTLHIAVGHTCFNEIKIGKKESKQANIGLLSIPIELNRTHKNLLIIHYDTPILCQIVSLISDIGAHSKHMSASRTVFIACV